MDTCLVTGGAGFIGSHIAGALLAQGKKVVVLDSLNGYYTGKEKNISGVMGNPGFKFIKGDILNKNDISQAIEGCNIVFHQAAQAGVRYSLDHPVEVNRINVEGTLNVLEAARKSSIQRFVFASSSSVYGSAKYAPMDEEHPKVPVSPYGVSKLASEEYCMLYWRLYGLPVVSLRYFTVYGPGQRPDMAINIFTRKIIAGERPVIYGDGDQTRDFTYVEDIVSANLAAMEKKGAVGEVFNIGGGNRITVNRLVGLIKEYSGSAAEPLHVEAPKGEAHDTLADVSKAKRVLEYDPTTRIEVGLRKYVDWFVNTQRSR